MPVSDDGLSIKGIISERDIVKAISKDRENSLIEANFSDTLDQNTEYDQGGDFFGKHFSIRDYYAVLTNSEDFDTYFDRDSLVNINSNPLDHFYKFTVVRNPWDRFVSYYLDYVEDQNEENFKDFALLAGTLQDASFPKPYLKNPVSLNLLSQSNVLFNKYTNFNDFDKILKFENLENDFKDLCDDLDLEYEALPHLAQSSDRAHYSEYYNEETKGIIEEAWSEDVTNFGYEYETV